MPCASSSGSTPAMRPGWTTWRGPAPSGATPARLLPGCRSVIAVALAYGPREDDPSWAPVSLYARGGDYHDLMRGRLLALAAYLREAGGPSVESRAAVDTSAVLERDLAARRRTGVDRQEHQPDRARRRLLLLHRDRAHHRGARARRAAADHCGTCTACLDACPTAALRRAPRARRAPLSGVPHDRAPWRHPRRVEAGHERVALRLRRLPGRVPVEPQGADMRASPRWRPRRRCRRWRRC